MASLKDLLVSGAAKLLSTLRVSGDTHIDGTLYLNGAIGGTKQPVYVDSTGKFVAGTSFSNVTNYDQSVAIKEITRTANATTYILKTIAGATSTVATPVATGTANRLAIYTDAYNIGQSTISFASETLTVPGAVVPSTTNARTLGTSSSRWSKLYLGTADSYGSTYVPIYWNAGVPTAVTANNMLTDLGSTTGVNVFQQNPRPGITGTLGVGNGGTGKTSWTQWGVLYASASNTLVNTAAGTTGKYLGAITNGAPIWKDILANEIHPSISKTYTPTESYGTADSDAACSFYFISVKPDSWYKPWQIRFRVRSYCASHTNADSVTWTTLNGRADSMIYHNWNERYDIGHYYIAAHILKSAGFNAGLGHAVGISVRYATGRGNTEYNRTIELDYYDCYGCTVTVLDSATKWSGWTNGTDTNYNGYSNFDAVNRGLRETSDDNSTSISHWYEQYGGFVAGNNIKRYQFVFQQLPSNQNKLITLFETDNAYGTTNKTLLTTEFDPLGLMFHYYSSGTNNNATNIDPGRLYSTGVFDLRYTFNVTSTASDTTFTGVRYTPLYLRVNINPATGGASVDGNQPLVTTLPTAADGKHYIYLGQVHSWYQLYFTAKHPVYYHDGTRICRYYGNSNHLNVMVNGGLEIRGHIAGDSSGTTGHGLYSGGGYHSAYNNIILHGDASTGSSGIAFVSDKVTNGKTIANINAPSDRAFIQYHACGVSTYTAEGTTPTLATSGEAGKLIIGVGNDAGDQIHLQAPSHTDLLHRIGASAYVIPDTNNTSGTVGGTTQPVYVSSGIITAANTYAGGTAVTLNNASKASSTASFYAPTSGGTQNTQALVGDGATAAPKWVNISPSVTITAGTSSATPKVNVTVLGQSGTAQSITTATTSVYGATKLTNAYTSTDESLAATGKSILAAIQTLDVSAVGVAAATGNRYICQISEADGKISATLATVTIGSASQPVWINGGTITALTGTIANDISGNAATATAFSSNATVTLTGDTTGTSAGSTKSWSITTKTDRISTVGDNRSTATTPNDYSNKIIFQGLKTNSSFGSPSSDSYSYVVGLRGWSDNSGGNSHEFAFNNTGIYRRSGATTTWGNWLKILDSGNYTDYTVTKTGTGASGTWGISITGNAATATKFASAQSITLTGDTTGSASSQAGWSIATTTSKLSYSTQITTIAELDAFGKGATKMVVAKVSAISGLNGTWNSNDGMVISIPWGGNYGHQIYIDDTSYHIHHRYYVDAKDENDQHYTSYKPWVQIIDSSNYTSYTVTKTGSGASGTWGINISGNAATATALTSNAGSLTQPIYFTGGKPAATSYALKATVNAGAAQYFAYYSGANAISQTTNLKIYEGTASAGKTYINWIKIAKITLNTSNHFGSHIIDFHISRTYNSPASETYTIRVNVGWGNVSLKQIGGRAGTQIIDTFRVVQDSTNHVVYFEYNVKNTYTTYQNSVDLTIIAYTNDTLTLMNEVQTEADSAFDILGSIPLNSINVLGDVESGTASRIAYYNTANKINSSSITTDGTNITMPTSSLITVGYNNTHRGIKIGNTYINAIGENLILQNNGAIRFGADSWDYNIWAGLKYVSSSKSIYLGLADGTIFTANSAQTAGSLYFPGIDKVILTKNSGGIYKYYGTATTAPFLQVNSNNFDVSILKIDGDNPTDIRDSQAYGFNLKYIGTGSGAGKTLRLYADNSNNTDVLATEWSGDGRIGIGTNYSSSYRLYVNGSTYIDSFLHIGGATNATMTAASTNPRICFSEGASGQPVYLIYSDYDNYRAPAGLKVVGGASANPAWFEVEGSYYATGTGVNQSYYLHSSNIEYGRFWISTKGVAGTATTYTNPNDSSQTKTGYTGNVTGLAYLSIGNSRVAGSNGSSYSSPGSLGVVDNAQGYLRLYSAGSGYADMTAYTSDKTRIYPVEGINLPENKAVINFRPGTSSYYTYASYQTTGNEALVMATTQAITSFIFVNGETIGNVAQDRWTKLTGASGAGNAPGLQIKQNCVHIGGLWGSGTNADYKLRLDNGRTYLNYTTASSTTNLTGQLMVANDNGGNVAIELWRNANASWQIANEGGILYLRNNYTTAKQSTYSQTSLILDYNTGAGSIPYLTIGQTARNTSYKLYVNGTAYATSVSIGASASYGSTTQPIYWNAGVPTAVSANSLIVNLATTSGASVYASAPRPGVTGTLPVGNGGTGATTFTSGYALIGNGTSAIQTRGIRNNTSAGALGWTSASTDTTLVTTNTIAYWNGAYSGTSSNLAYCNKGAFGTMATQTATDYIAKSIGTTKGDIIYWSAASTPARLAIGSNGQFLTISNGIPTWASITVNGYVLKSGDTMTGLLTHKGIAGTLNIDYGETLPSSPSVGQIFFQYGPNALHELPAGGPATYVLVKNSIADYDVKWSALFTNNQSTKFYVAGPTTTSASGVGIFNTNVYVQNNVLYGAAWNDYAEYRERKGKYVSPGRCVVENGDGSLSQSTKRLQPGAEIVSDTYGFAIGKTNKCKMPIAVSGRVLAYPYENINTYKVGAPVCSGPNGTVSQMTDEEARLYPWLIIGTVSSIPTEETWGANNIKINGRIWIRVK